MYRLSQLAGMKMDIFRCDGDKGMAGLPFQYGCAKHKFETFRRPRRIDGVPQTAYIPGRAPDNKNHPGLAIYLQACREMTEGPKIYLLDELIRLHGHSSNSAAFKDELYRSLPQIDLVQSVMMGKEPLGELTNNTVEGGNSRLKTEGLKDLPPVDFFHQMHAMERDYWTRELEACLAWIKKTVRFMSFYLTLYHALFCCFSWHFVSFIFFCCFPSTMVLLLTKGDEGISETVTHEISTHVRQGRAKWTIRTHPPGLFLTVYNKKIKKNHPINMVFFSPYNQSSIDFSISFTCLSSRFIVPSVLPSFQHTFLPKCLAAKAGRRSLDTHSLQGYQPSVITCAFIHATKAGEI